MTRKRAGRRGNNEGAIYRLADGRWRGAVLLGYRNGKPYRKYVTRATRAEVTDEIRKLIEAHRSGQVVTTGSCTVAEWMDTYFEQVAKSRVRPRTYERYVRDNRLHVVPSIGKIKLDKLTPAHLVALYDAKLQEGKAPSSVRHLHAVIRRALAVAVRWRLVAVNVATLVDPPSVRQHEVRPLTQSEAQAVVDAAHHDELEARWLVGLALGLRQGEALGLWWDDVDLEGGVLHVRRALQRQRDRGLVFVEPKTARSRRTIPLPPQLIDALQRHRTRQSKQRLAAGTAWQQSPCVFTTATGTPIDPRNDNRMFKCLLRSAKVRDVRLHDLRHTAASLLLAQGVPPRVVMEILGHSQIALTMNTYTHVAGELTRAATGRMAEALWPAQPDQPGVTGEAGAPA